MKVPTFMKTMRFKLTVWYTALLVLLAIFIILWINLGFRFWDDRKPPRWNELMTQEERFESFRAESQQNILTISLISAAGALVIGAIGGYLLSGRLLKPVDNITSLAARISGSNLKERINHEGPDDEMKHLANTFDGMLARLDDAFERQKQFIQDASHELKTPVAVALTNIEVVEMEDKVTSQEYKRVMGVVKLSLERMDRLSKKLLVLSGEQNMSQWAAVNVNELLSEITTEFTDSARVADITVNLELPSDPIQVKGDFPYLREAIINLVDNAIKYNKPRTKMTVSGRVDDSRVVIEVKDNGIGISQQDQRRIFDRFYRVDKSRSRDRGGAGLGLAIVKKVIESHGGTVTVDSSPGKGSAFIINLPLAD